MRKWIQGMHMHKEALTKKAKAAGMSAMEYAAHVSAHPDEYSGKTRKQASLAKTLKGFHK